MVKLVIDSNMLREEELRRFLANPRNYAVLTDYAAMEAYKGDTLRTIYKSMEIVSERPKQVIVLKGTRKVTGLSGRASGLQRRMIDQEQTKGFSEYCRALQAAKRGSPRLQAELLRLGREADEHLGKVLSDAAALPMSFDEITENYTENELRIIRTGGKFTPNMIDKFLQFVMVMAGEFTKSPFSRKPKSLSELPNLFVFRYALCSYLLTIGWISVGGAKNVKSERLRNDVVDMIFAAFGTYFDGIMTSDKKVRLIHDEASYLIKEFFSHL